MSNITFRRNKNLIRHRKSRKNGKSQRNGAKRKTMRNLRRMRMSNGGAHSNKWNLNIRKEKKNPRQINIDHNAFLEEYKDKLKKLHVINAKNIHRIYYDIFVWDRQYNDRGDDKFGVTFKFEIEMLNNGKRTYETVTLECVVPNITAENDEDFRNYKPMNIRGYSTECTDANLQYDPYVKLLFDFAATDDRNHAGESRHTCDESLEFLSAYLARYAYVNEKGKETLAKLFPNRR